MDHGPFWLRPPRAGQLRSILAAARDQTPSYQEVGATRGPLPPGYHTVEQAVVLGAGSDVFARAADGIRAWAPQRHAGIGLLPDMPAIAEGETVLLSFRSFPFFVTSTCRIVYVVDEANRFGYGYGTLPHHPEQGEEAFLVEQDAGGTVTFSIRAFSRPAHLLTRLGGPVGRIVQARVTRRYLEGLGRP